MPPVDRLVCRFAAEPPQEPLPYGRWEERLRGAFLAACLRVDTEGEQLGEPGEVRWYPDRSWGGRTFVPATVATAAGFEYYGYVSFATPPGGEEPESCDGWAEYTAETAMRNADWRLDLCDAEIGSWRGEEGRQATMTLVWGVPLVGGGAIVTAELAELAVDQCVLVEDRFTLIAPDAYRSDLLEVLLWDPRGSELARESLYAEGEDDGDDEQQEEEEEERRN